MSKYIVVEGLEGSGKSTAIEFIKQWLNARGISQIATVREPGGTPIAEELRRLIKQKSTDDHMEPLTELLLLYAARIQLVNTVIKPTLQNGGWVIGDRHELSTRAYQGGGRGINPVTLETLWQLSLNGFKPDLTIYLDIDPQMGLQRVAQRGATDRIEEESLAFFQRARAVYCEYVKQQPNIYLINAAQSLEAVHADIGSVLQQSGIL